MADTDICIVVSTAFGPIALSTEDLRTAQIRADNLVDRSAMPHSQPTSTTLINASEIAQIFDMDASWFLTRAREKRIPHIRLGKYVRFDPEEIREYFHRKVQ